MKTVLNPTALSRAATASLASGHSDCAPMKPTFPGQLRAQRLRTVAKPRRKLVRLVTY